MKPKSQKWNGHAATYAHLKLDGHFLEVNVEESGAFFYTSHPTDITDKMPESLHNALDACEPGDKFYAELWVPGENASFVKTAIKERDERLDFVGFATPNLPEEAPLRDVEAWFRKRGLAFAQWERLEPGWSPEGLMNLAKNLEAEGWMLKDGNLLNWRKLKAEPTIDLVVTGVTDGKGKHEGLIGSLICSAYGDTRSYFEKWSDVIRGTPKEERKPEMGLIEVCRAGGMTDDERVEMTLHEPIGRVVEIGYQRVDSKKRLRHPRFIRYRDDKSPLECTLDQDEELVR